MIAGRPIGPARNPGVAYALAAYFAWGLLPLFLRLLAPTPTGEILAHRIVWSFVTVLFLLLVTRRIARLGPALAQPRRLLRFVATAALISINWLLYIWSIQSGHVVDASLGYFINPLVNIVLAALLLHERLRAGQKLAVALAALGVAWLTWLAGAPPWIGLAIAVSFALYGLLRRDAALGALEGFAVETAVLAPLALAYLAWLWWRDELAFADAPASMRWLLLAAGPITTVPLLLFAAATRRISFSMVGVLQYLSPSLQWLVGIYAFHEAFDPRKAIGFGFIWLALLIYAAESLRAGWRQARARQ